MNNSQKNLNNDEIIIKDQQGKFKIWQNQQWRDFIASSSPEVKKPAVEQKAIIETGMEGPFLFPPPPLVKRRGPSVPPSISLRASLDNQGFYPPADLTQEKLIDKQQKKYGINKIINKVIEVLLLKFDLEAKTRFKKIIFSYARHIRSLLDVLETLQQPKDSGGLGLNLIEAERIMALVKNIVNRIDQEGGLIIDDEEMEIAIKPEAVKEPLKPRITPPPIKEKPAKVEELVAIKPRLVRQPSFPKVSRPFIEKAKQITEVKKRPVITGQVEELASFTLADFRRLAASPHQQAGKIFKKIELLAEESFTKKAEGIKAWRQSPVHRQYLMIGAASIKQGKSVNQVIEELLAKDNQSLTIAEFEALADLSRKLRF